MALRLGEMLVQAGRITQEQLDQALKIQKESGGKLMLGQVLVKIGAIPNENVISEFVARQINVGTIKLSDLELDVETVKLIPEDIARKFTVIATIKVAKFLFVAIPDPRNVFVLDTLKFITACDVQPVVASAEQINAAIEKYYRAKENNIDDIVGELQADMDLEVVEEKSEFSDSDLEKAINEKPLVKLVDSILVNAIRSGISDIHIETFEKSMRLRYRMDGVLREMSPLPFKLRAAIVSRVKIMSKLNISERRLPQDGRISMNVGGRKVDLRVSICPTIFGEKVVMRILDPNSLMLDMTKLGFPERALKEFNKAIRLPYGMILVTGPTGSGKTTTLYSALSTINAIETNIMTAEDPVEFNLYGINQVLVRSEIGLTFAEALRSFLRQDPNIVMVGEIRDLETAEIGIKAALTGHLVFSTVHTNDAPSTINRMVDMGVAPFLVSSAVKLILAQRLLRRICRDCKYEVRPTEEQIDLMGLTEEDAAKMHFFAGKGCPTCNGAGLKGRTGVYEMMVITKKLERLIIEGASNQELEHQACLDGMVTLRQEALNKLNAGEVTIEQVIAETAG